MIKVSKLYFLIIFIFLLSLNQPLISDEYLNSYILIESHIRDMHPDIKYIQIEYDIDTSIIYNSNYKLYKGNVYKCKVFDIYNNKVYKTTLLYDSDNKIIKEIIILWE